MKNLFFISIISLLNIYFTFAQQRIEIPLNENWKFSKGNPGNVYQINFDDSGWQNVSLPNTWNNLDGQDGGTYYRGSGWYRKSFIIPENLNLKKIFIRFGAANMIADVYLNGKFVGEHKGGYAAFIFDITKFINFGSKNILAVKVDNTDFKNSDEFHLAPLDADYTMDGGLYRKVKLIVTNDLHISLTDYASPGIFITQKNVSDNHADISLLSELKNDSNKKQEITLNSSIYDKDGKIVTNNSRNIFISPNASSNCIQSFSINNPHLWNGRNDPYLYKVVVSIYKNKKLFDEVSQPLGLRYFKVDPDKGFFLNGKPYKLHGFCLHEDKKNKGRAISNSDRKEEMDYMLDIGATIVRLAHYQHGQDMYRLCDKSGIVVWTEIPLVNHIDTSSYFAINCEQQLKELIRQNYNHPSILFWGIFNELGNVKGPDPISLVKNLNKLAKKEDSTRYTTAAANYSDIPAAFVTDVLGLNKYFGWYNGTSKELGTYLDKWHHEHPDRAIGLSEYGAGASIYQHEDNPKQPRTDGPWHPEEYQTNFHEIVWKEIEARPYIWFSTLWNGFDFASDSRREGFQPGINDKGIITQDHATKKDAYYWYKVNWNPAPMVHITDKRFTKRDTSSINIKVYSNADEVELILNGASLGKIQSKDHRFIWNSVLLKSGENNVKAVALIKGREYSDECWWKL